jgi:BASS family bile acid:Na+ symporter
MLRADPVAEAFFIIFIVGCMAGIGMEVNRAQIAEVFRRKSLLARSLVLNFVLIPIFGVLLARTLTQDPAVATALVLFACAPGGLSAIQFSGKAEGALAYARALTLLLSFLALIVSPVLMTLAWPSGTELPVPYLRGLGLLLVLFVLPLAIGLVVHERAAAVAGKLAKPLVLLGTVAFVAMIVKTTAMRNEATAALARQETGTILLLVVFAIVAGWLLAGRVADERKVLADTSSMRNAALCFFIAAHSFPEEKVQIAVVACAGLMVPMNFLFTVVVAVGGKIAAKRQAKASA